MVKISYHRDISPKHRSLSIIWIIPEQKALVKNGFHRKIALKIPKKCIALGLWYEFISMCYKVRHKKGHF